MSGHTSDGRTREGPTAVPEGETLRARAHRPSEYTARVYAGDAPSAVEALTRAARRMTERASTSSSEFLVTLCAMKVAEARALVLVLSAAEHRARYREVRRDA